MDDFFEKHDKFFGKGVPKSKDRKFMVEDVSLKTCERDVTTR